MTGGQEAEDRLARECADEEAAKAERRWAAWRRRQGAGDLGTLAPRPFGPSVVDNLEDLDRRA